MQVTATIGKDHFKTTIETSAKTLIADEPLDKGGKDLGPTPHQLLASALASCTVMTVRSYADLKQMGLESVKAIVDIHRDLEKNETNITLDLELTGNLTEEQKQRLLQIAGRCPVHKTLSNPINIETKLV